MKEASPSKKGFRPFSYNGTHEWRGETWRKKLWNSINYIENAKNAARYFCKRRFLVEHAINIRTGGEW